MEYMYNMLFVSMEYMYNMFQWNTCLTCYLLFQRAGTPEPLNLCIYIYRERDI